MQSLQLVASRRGASLVVKKGPKRTRCSQFFSKHLSIACTHGSSCAAVGYYNARGSRNT